MKTPGNNPVHKPDRDPQGPSKEFLALMFMMIFGIVIVILKAIGLF